MKQYLISSNSHLLGQKCPITRTSFVIGEEVVECPKGHVFKLDSWELVNELCPVCAPHSFNDGTPEKEKHKTFPDPVPSSISAQIPSTEKSRSNSSFPIFLIVFLIGLILVPFLVLRYSTKTYNVTITSIYSWQQTSIVFEGNTEFSISYTSGGWTVDRALYEKVGPWGYSPNIDSLIHYPTTTECKLLPGEPYGVLIGRVDNSMPFVVQLDQDYYVNSKGNLLLAINDSPSCLTDNEGEVTLTIKIKHVFP